jgi:cardiolipin synthase (CMP-forming)
VRRRLTFRRFTGLDRSGPPPPETLPGAPLRPWTIPNAIGFIRLALIPVFLWLAWDTDGVGAGPAIVFAVIAWGDYADGIAARVTGQYSRLGAMLDPVVDRLLVISGVVVCWNFDLVPRWLLAVLVAREALMLVLAPLALRRGVALQINWWGRWGVWPAMGSLFFAICGLRDLATVFLAVGVVLLLIATVEYARSARRQLAEQQPATS